MLQELINALTLAADIEKMRVSVYTEGQASVSPSVRAYLQSVIKAQETVEKSWNL